MLRSKPNLKVSAIIFAAGAIIVIAAALLVLGPGPVSERIWMGPAAFDEQPFDRQKWIGYAENKDERVRTRMYHDLKAHHLKLGLTRAQVVRLLGKADEASRRLLEYQLGPDALGIDTNVLVLAFDRAGRLAHISWVNT